MHDILLLVLLKFHMGK